MRNRLLVIGFSLVCACMMYAQPRLRVPEIYFGVHGGVSASSIMFSPAVENMTPITQACVLGGNGGFVFRYAVHKYCALQVELNYQHRGWREHNDAGTYSRELHYVELPLLMNVNFGSERWRGIFNLGPQLGYCVADNGGKGTQIGTTTVQYELIDHKFDWGLAAGLGFYYRSRNAGLYQFEARFNYSFGGIFGTGLIDHFNMASPMDLSLNIAYMWEFKKKK
ncbi:MAG: PorT family protein [Paludibacteraceae bacterium]|nr:PorT family protein [Paludibacteraceae bacterium]